MDPVPAVGAFFREDPGRILAVAAHLRGPDRCLESTVVGMSMGQTIPANSRIRIELVQRHDYVLGDVVAFLAAGKVVVHRIAYQGRRGAARGHLLTRGDAALVPDPPLTADCILGPVTAIRRGETWVPLGELPRRSFSARVTAAVALAIVAAALRTSPRLAEQLVRVLHRGRPLRAACSGLAERPAAS